MYVFNFQLSLSKNDRSNRFYNKEEEQQKIIFKDQIIDNSIPVVTKSFQHA